MKITRYTVLHLHVSTSIVYMYVQYLIISGENIHIQYMYMYSVCSEFQTGFLVSVGKSMISVHKDSLNNSTTIIFVADPL